MKRVRTLLLRVIGSVGKGPAPSSGTMCIPEDPGLD